jgi:hypothetical protein
MDHAKALKLAAEVSQQNDVNGDAVDLETLQGKLSFRRHLQTPGKTGMGRTTS